MAEESNVISENKYPWGGKPRILSFPNETQFQAFISILETATKQLSTMHHFDSITSLIDLHTRFSTSNCKLEQVWRDIPVEECENMKEMTCIGLALTLKKLLIHTNPEWTDCIALGITNEWTSSKSVTEAFWTSVGPPLFPTQCREHSLLFIRVLLQQKRNLVVFLDPGRNMGTPLVVTEDGLYPQSPTLVLKRHNKTREHTVSWGGADYMRWVIASRKGDSYLQTLLRVYVGRHFDAGSYLDWHNLVFPFRALMFMTPGNGLMCLRVEVGKSVDNVVVMIVDAETDNVTQLEVPFESEVSKWNETQTLVMNLLSSRSGQDKLLNLMTRLRIVMSDQKFAAQLLAIWDKVKQETEDSFECFVK